MQLCQPERTALTSMHKIFQERGRSGDLYFAMYAKHYPCHVATYLSNLFPSTHPGRQQSPLAIKQATSKWGLQRHGPISVGEAVKELVPLSLERFKYVSI